MIYGTTLVEDHSPERFEIKLRGVINSYQTGNRPLEVELQYDAERAYTCLVIARSPA